MRLMITGSGFFVVLALIIVIHGSIISRNLAGQEVERGLDSAMDYAFDKMTEQYTFKEVSLMNDKEKEKLILDCMEEFCLILSKTVTSTAQINVALVYCDVDKGIFQIRAEEDFEYPLHGKRGECYYEKTYCVAVE